MEQVIELVSYTLVEGVTEQDIVAATEQSQRFIATLPGFLYRSLSHDCTTNRWTDIVYWQTMDDAKNAGEQFTACPDCQPLMGLIEHPSLVMQHQLIKMSSCSTQ
ncbi:hypothetical protein M5225_003808 [Vibrio vulnificus]|uniref:hypothetical protein n=1 Tax=Vibrio vulnificus TaxID=672 RepID=UPI002933F874|nr:hypothetical protein [Vibrio vulnificus]EHZ2903274.1 hypothetical protein [Vibrio vulnificus]EIA1337038.1 hypothetical protein [Vibrio vulnificus]EIA1774158.1 hypothetical protein [Vibrio vulnificus]EIU7597128.1 hypothetical protein [Vibrio vulnificus]